MGKPNGCNKSLETGLLPPVINVSKQGSPVPQPVDVEVHIMTAQTSGNGSVSKNERRRINASETMPNIGLRQPEALENCVKRDRAPVINIPERIHKSSKHTLSCTALIGVPMVEGMEHEC